MSESAKALLEEFDSLSAADRQQVLVQLLRRTSIGEYDALDDQTLVESADLLFLELDKRENEK